jgi:Holliday junction resolvasome RuvABC endonuclease subunit
VRVLAFDLSSHVGWALFDDRQLVRSDTWNTPPEMVGRFGRRFTAAYVFAREIIATQKPDVVAFEAPIQPRAGTRDLKNTHPINLRFLQGLATIFEMVAHMENVRCVEVANGTAKKRLAGSGRAKKPAMIVAAIKQGFIVANDHEADACAVALAALDHVGVP